MDSAAVKIGRLYKKVERLKEQRDYWKQRATAYETVMSWHSGIRSSYDAYKERQAEREHMRALEARVKEQALLISKLQK